MDDIENEPRTDPSVDEGYESDVNESDIELEGETVEPDNDPPQKVLLKISSKYFIVYIHRYR